MPADKRIKIRRGTAAEWATAETSAAQLAAGEVAWVDNDLVKGDGTTKVASLPRAGTGTYVPAGSTVVLPRWQRALEVSPSTAVISIVGDSTSDEVTAAGYMYARLRIQHTQPGEALYGMTSDVFADGATTNASKTFTSATGAFTSTDVGRVIVGTNIPFGTTVASIDSTTQIQLSANATGTGTGQMWHIGRHIVNRGNNGMTLATWLGDPTKLAALVADAPNLIIASWLINDVRFGMVDYETAKSRLQQFVSTVKTALPNADILLRIPNTLLTTNVGSNNLVQGPPGDGSNINPAGAAQSYSTLLRRVYLSLEGVYPNVAVADVQAAVFGTVARATHPIMGDQLHPAPSGSTTNGNPTGGGYVAIADYLASVIGAKRGAFTADPQSYRVAREWTIFTAGNGFLDIGATNPVSANPAQFPLTTSDVLFVEGMAGPISLASASITRPFGGTSVRIGSLTGNDFTNYLGRTAWIMANHPDATTGDRQIVSVDLPSIAAGATTAVTVAVTGARTGALHDATAVVATPPAGASGAGLLLLGCYPTANDTVTIVVNNPTGGAIDRAAENWAFWVVR